ncbi:MAG: amidohydrolase [Polyangiaceae bacterium]|nr:amidohydrolase [Polyangiaceae bacterium]
MLRRILALLGVGLAAIVIAGYFALRTPPPPHSSAYLNGTVLTMNAAGTVAQALYVEGDRIVAVGTKAEIEKHMVAETEVHDLHGGSVLPGFIDAHGHFPGTSLELFAVPLHSAPVGDIQSIPPALARLKQKAAETDAGEWVIALGWDDTLVDEKRNLTRDDLDKVSTDHPVLVLHVSGHMGMVNSRGLSVIGIDANTPDPVGGVIQRDKSGRANGVLEERARMAAFDLAFDLGLEEFLAMLDHGGKQYAAVGVTTAQSGLSVETTVRAMSVASWLGLLPIRLMVWPDEKMGLEMARGERSRDTWHRSELDIGAIKLIADGSIQGFTGYLSEPYHTPHNGDPNYRGYPTIPRKRLIELVTELHGAGFQIAIHGNGDASIDDILDAFAAAQKASPRDDTRHIIVHAQMTRADQLRRMKRLGVTPSFFVAHTYYWGDRHRDIFMGPERAARMSPAASAKKLGVPFTIHLDAPVVPMDPLFLVWTAVTRTSTSGKVIGEAERISIMDAFRAITIDAAWQIHQEKNRGSLEVGKYADLVVLNRDPRGSPKALRKLKVERTVVGGLTVFQR